MATWNNIALSRNEIREQKRIALVKQAASEFRKRGYHATSMGDIADALGVTKGALYRYVKSKDEVLFECFMHSNAIGKNALKKAEELEGNSIDKLVMFIKIFIENYLDSNLAGGAMIEIDSLLPEQRNKVVNGRDYIDKKLRNLIKLGINDGLIIDQDPKLLIFSFMGAINWIPSWYSKNGEYSTKQIAEKMSQILVEGLRYRS